MRSSKRDEETKVEKVKTPKVESKAGSTQRVSKTEHSHQNLAVHS